MLHHWAGTLWLLLFAVVPFALYIAAVSTNAWACFDVLPGSKLRLEDDDNPEYIELTPGGGPVILTYNWSGTLCFGLWKFSLQPLVNGSLGEKEEKSISNCYQSTSADSHHRICPILILVRSFAVIAPILTVIFCITICHVMRRRSTIFTERWDAIVFSFLPGITGCVGWIVFHCTFVLHLTPAAEFLPIYTKSDFFWEPHTPLDYSQALYVVAWSLQVLIAMAFLCVSLRRCCNLAPANEDEAAAEPLIA